MTDRTHEACEAENSRLRAELDNLIAVVESSPKFGTLGDGTHAGYRVDKFRFRAAIVRGSDDE